MAYNERPANCPDEVDALETYGGNWPSDQPFPFTPLEAWWILQGYAVKPQADLTMDQFDQLPGKIERSNGYVVLWRA